MRVIRSSGEEVDVEQLDLELFKLRRQKENLATLTGEVERQNALVAQMLADRGQKSRRYDGYQYTLVQAERVKVNESGLKKALGARLFNKLCVQKLDQAKLKTAMTEGAVDPVIVEQFSEVALNKPAIRITEVIETDG